MTAIEDSLPIGFEEIRQHETWLRRLVGRLVDGDGVDDVVQETWLAAWRKPPADAGTMHHWLARVARRFALMRRRAEARRDRRVFAAASAERIDSAEENVARLFALRDVSNAILALPDPYRTTVLLRFMEELDTKEIAARMATTEGTVRVRVSRALVLLRRRLGSRYANGWRAALTAVAAVPIKAFTYPLNLAFFMNVTALASLLVLTWEIVSAPALWRGAADVGPTAVASAQDPASRPQGAESRGSAAGPIEVRAPTMPGKRAPAPMLNRTLIADYSENRVLEVDADGVELWRLDKVLGAWDVQRLENDNLLVTEFSAGQVREVTREGMTVWSYQQLKNPYRAHRLANGNTLICDTFSDRVIEVDRAGAIVWSFVGGIKPASAERLADGNTLVADMLRDRVIEVTPAGVVAWEVRNMLGVYDARRLANGNTLVTLRTLNKVVELDKDGKKVWSLTNLSSPSTARRLPNGNTLVAENGGVREFDAEEKVVWKRAATWAVAVERY